MSLLPTLSQTIDDDFMNTHYEIRAMLIDNVLKATIFTLALKEHGAFKSEPAGTFITRSVGYGEKSIQRFGKGSTLTQSTQQTDTMGRWFWRYFLVDVNRTMIDDALNSGPHKIKDYVSRRLEVARNALVQDLETDLHRWGEYYATSVDQQINGLYDICPMATAESAVGAGRASDAYDGAGATGDVNNGQLDRFSNTWWRNWTMENGASASSAAQDLLFNAGPTSAPYSLNLVPDMRHFYNKISANQEAPNFIMMDQDIYEAYQDEASDKQQIVRSAFSKLAADLNFEVMTFNGATMTYSAKLSGTKHLFMLNLNHVEMPYHPSMWFDMTEWLTTPNQLERVAYIACMTPGLITDQPRRHGGMEYAS